MSGRRDLPAGRFSVWLREVRAALVDGRGIDMPCGDCCACCATSHFVHVGPGEARSLSRIPRELLFPAPGYPPGTLVVGYDRDGRCPMLDGGRCSIYEDRPLTCRTYDCRVFAAAGIDADRDAITRQSRRWEFELSAHEDRDQHRAVRAAARFVREHAACFPGGAVPGEPAQLAVLAVSVFDVFLEVGDASADSAHEASDLRVAEAVIAANGRFEAARAAARRHG
jgi:uncharacterized protein